MMEEIDFIQPKKTVGKLISADVLDKRRTEREELADADCYGDYQLGFSFGLMMAMEIIDKYRAEREKV